MSGGGRDILCPSEGAASEEGPKAMGDGDGGRGKRPRSASYERDEAADLYREQYGLDEEEEGEAEAEAEAAPAAAFAAGRAAVYAAAPAAAPAAALAAARAPPGSRHAEWSWQTPTCKQCRLYTSMCRC